ncbi:prostaglandin G/H synthase 2-like [Mus caroli]|uniref:Prostaglandin G/H synthase 2-like n=1 Tax=Mus caroli TaxID=10089 RepID=A0A6P5P263_MUSCR|nr:prostaglandin G/H synthase 2-like [Mus caroli]
MALVSIIGGEVYPLRVRDTQVDTQFAVGPEVFGLVPGLLMYATIWFWEHKRVCDILKQEHLEWEDERLFQTSRLILIGETSKIVIKDYLQHLTSYHFKLLFDPELLFNLQLHYHNCIASEFNTLYHWHPLLPHNFKVPGGRNLLITLKAVAKSSIDQTIEVKYQSLTEYCKHFSLTPYTAFEELPGEKEMAAELKALSSGFDVMELYPNLVVEKPHQHAIFRETMVEPGLQFPLRGLMGNSICSLQYWKTSTFGGKVGFKIINTDSIHSLLYKPVKELPVRQLLECPPPPLPPPPPPPGLLVPLSPDRSGLDPPLRSPRRAHPHPRRKEKERTNAKSGRDYAGDNRALKRKGRADPGGKEGFSMGVGGDGGARPALLQSPARSTQPSEPIPIPKLRFRLADLPNLHCSNMSEALHPGVLLQTWVRPGARSTPSPQNFQVPARAHL